MTFQLAKVLPATLADAQTTRRATLKGLPHQVVKAEARKSKEALGKAFRRAVWIRDHGRSRASGKPLAHSGTDWNRVGEVHHEYKRSTHPDKIYEVSCGVLLSKTEHALAETRCTNAPEFYMLSRTGPEDMGELQSWVWRDVDGKILRKRVG